MKNKKIVIATIGVVLFACFFLLGPHLAIHDPYETNLANRFITPGDSIYLLGTDSLGRCMLCRILTGGQISVYSSLSVIAIVFTVGSLLGIVSGYMGGAFDAAISKLTVVFQAFPSFVLAIAIAGIMGPGLKNGIISLSLVYWTTYCRLARSLVLQLRDAPYVRAARMCGAKEYHIMIKYLMPEMIPQLIITAMLDVGNVILSMAGLSFIGLGAKRPTAEWGAMMSESRSYLQSAPWSIIMPGIAIFIVVIAFNLYGDFVRDSLKRKER